MVTFNRKGIDFIFFLGFLSITLLFSVFSGHNPQNNSIKFLIDSLGNTGGVIVASFFFNCFAKRTMFKDRIVIALTAGVGLIIYEFLQKWIPWQTFDKNDILGSLIGIIIAILLNGLVTFFLGFKNREIS
jgi:hypothetical protein